jgi:pyruvate dehydrogenase E1 component beta subunit
MSSISADISHHVQRHAFDYLDAPVQRVNSKDVPLAYAPTLVEASLPTVKRTIEAVKSVLYVK